MLTRNIQILLILLVFHFVPAAAAVPVPELSASEINVLEQLASYIGKERQPDQLLPGSDSSSCPARAVRIALEFANFPSSSKQALFNQFAVNDYPARSTGVYNMVSGSEVIGVVKAIETKYPQITDKRIYLAMAFCGFKDQNMWFNSDKGRVSAARFFRSAFLASVFNGANIDTSEITNAIDIKTQQDGGF